MTRSFSYRQDSVRSPEIIQLNESIEANLAIIPDIPIAAAEAAANFGGAEDLDYEPETS